MTTSEKFTIDGKDVVGKIKEIIREGNVRRIRLIHADRNIIDIPLTVGASAAAITVLAAPVLVALGALAAVLTECTLEIEKVDDTSKDN
jgi:hypothetical protein